MEAETEAEEEVSEERKRGRENLLSVERRKANGVKMKTNDGDKR